MNITSMTAVRIKDLYGRLLMMVWLNLVVVFPISGHFIRLGGGGIGLIFAGIAHMHATDQISNIKFGIQDGYKYFCMRRDLYGFF